MTSPVRVWAPKWPVAPRVRAVTTLRAGGVSKTPYATLNLAGHVGDNVAAVQENRRRLATALALPTEPVWLNQAHGCRVVDVERVDSNSQADGVVTRRVGTVCAVLTADCLPLFLCNRAATEVGVLHVGWRGMAAGIIDQGIAAFAAPAEELLASLGPAISARRFEVGEEVRTALTFDDPRSAAAFVPSVNPGRWLADLYLLARWRLERLGVASITTPEAALCTFDQSDQFYSYRRTPTCGRMASLIWLI